ncbi:sensor histidine kinase [Deinococcus sedimenti]|uniref:histidine kinase n=1 Tax=Deinococcus sedimenti TaxID=1867090 RepID=A0ABQ2S5B3_9DEIO|nr:ATP-binding protein [Deinococcus sedimenti]GGR92208.1 hypothetical protein GCM10008960_18800 [Deinococcus sedimenti]
MTASDSAPARPQVALDPPMFASGGGDDLQFSYLHQVHDLSLDCIKIVSADGELLSMNRNGQAAMQVDDFSACQGADWLSFWQGEVREAMLAAFERARGGQAAHFSGYCPTMKGEPRWWDVTLAPLHDPVTRGAGGPLVIISRDVTAEFRAQQALTEVNAQLHAEVQRQTESLRRERQTLLQTNEELENLAYSMSHDLLTPVRHMLSFARLARTSDEQKRDRYLGIVERSAEHLSGMIEGVLKFSRAGRNPIQRSEVNLAALMRDVQTELTAGAEGRAVTWEIAELPQLTGDAAQLKQVLRSLCSNALKFTRTQPHAHIQVRAQRVDQAWEVQVQDNGVGFDQNYAHKLFRLFQRLHHHNEYPGAGADLATVRRIVDRHGGQVQADGQPGGGATFRFTVPDPVPVIVGTLPHS